MAYILSVGKDTITLSKFTVTLSKQYSKSHHKHFIKTFIFTKIRKNHNMIKVVFILRQANYNDELDYL